MTVMLIRVVLCPKSLAASSFSEGNEGTGDYKSLVRKLRLHNVLI
jgi:hypothetical protein